MTQKRKTKLTVQEFQTWLEGIMEFQDPDWSPTREQWTAIFDKIMNLKVETGGTVNISASSMKEINDNFDQLKREIENFKQASSLQQPARILEERDPRELLAGSGGASQQYQLPMEQEIISQEELVTLSEDEIREKINQAKKYGQSSGSRVQNPIKAPDIDTSDGTYKSSFV